MPEGTELRLEPYACSALEQIARDEASAPALLAKILAELRACLFESTLTVSELLERCHIRSHSIQKQFRKTFDTTIGAYLLDRRMEVASSLLSDTRRPVSDIGRAVGYPHPGNFSRVFKKWAGESPTSLRRATSSSFPQSEAPRVTLRELRRIFLDEASATEQERLFSHLELAYPQQMKDFSEIELEQALAELVWMAVRSLPFEQQRVIVGLQLCFTTPALFEYLQKKRTEVGRKDRRKGLEIAELALASLQNCEDIPEIANYRARAWAHLAVARRMMLDIPGAAEALNQAELAWQSPAQAKEDPLTAVILYRSKADFHRFHRDFPDALRETEKALEYIERLGDGEEKARTLLQKATILAQHPVAEDPVPVFGRVIETLENDQSVDDYILFATHCNLARYCILNGKKQCASSAMIRAANVAGSTPILQAHLTWLRGLYQTTYKSKSQGKKECERARSEFLSQEDHEAAAMISLELALNLVDQGAETQALVELEQARSCFDSLGISREVLACDLLIDYAEVAFAYSATVRERLLRLASKG